MLVYIQYMDPMGKDDSYHMIGKWILGFPFDKPTYADVGNVPQYSGL